jgi:hypothetical protein
VILLLCKCKLNLWQLPCNLSFMKLFISKHLVELCIITCIHLFLYTESVLHGHLYNFYWHYSHKMYIQLAFIMYLIWEVLRTSFIVKYM